MNPADHPRHPPTPPPPTPPPPTPPTPTRSLRVVEPGIATTVQDPGRPGLAHIGIPAAGWVDPESARLSNRLAGNDQTAAVLETAGGLILEALGPTLVADTVTCAPRLLRRGDLHHVPAAPHRAWSYLAVHGGIDVDRVLGSRSYDTLSALGPAPPERGQLLPIGPRPGDPTAAADVVLADVAPLAPLADRISVTPGPRLDWFDDSAWNTLRGAIVKVVAGNRIGVRLHGPPLARRRMHELESEGLVRGAIQVPSDGTMVMMLNDHPTTGGYPVVAVVDPDDVAIVAQTPPGRPLRMFAR